MGVVLPAESHPVFVEGQEAVIGNGHAMGVAGQVTDDMLGSAERWFGIDDPVVAKQGAQKRAEGCLELERLESSCEGELVLLKSSFQTCHKLTAKHFGQNSHGQEELISRMNPATVIGA